VRFLRRKVTIVAAVVVALAIGGVVMYARGGAATVQYRTATATLGTIEQTLSLTGNLASVSQANVNFQVAGTVTGVTVTAGQSVTAGQVLATIDATSLQASLTQAQAALQAAQAKLTADQSSGSSSSTQNQTAVATDRTNLANDEVAENDTVAVNAQTINVDNQTIATDAQKVSQDQAAANQAQNQYNTDGCSPGSATPTCQTDSQNLAAAQTQLSKDQQALGMAQSTLQSDTLRAQQSNDSAKARVASDQTALSNALALLAAGNNAASQAQTIAQDQASVAQAQLAVTNDQKSVDAATLTAPMSGQVAAVNIAAGSTVSAGGSNASASGGAATIAFVLLTPGHFQVTGSVSDSQVNQVATGQHAVVTPAGATQGINAIVSAVGVLGTVTSGVATFPVTVDISGSHASLRSGMSAIVTVIINQVVGVLTVPTSAVHTNGGSSSVQVLKNGAPVSTPVTVGASDATLTEIQSGLNPGDTVVIATVTATIPTTTSGPTGGRGGFGGGGGGGGFGGGVAP
jgi:multidrug efflux pump subunit AcrA (membrane-fusion protein)